MSLRRRLFGAGFLALAVGSIAGTAARRFAGGAVEIPAASDLGGLWSLVDPAGAAAGAVFFVAGVAAVRDVDLSARAGLAAPLVAGVCGAGLAVGAGVVPTLGPGTLLDPVVFVVAGAVVGGSLAPVVLGATRGDTVALLVGAVLILVGLAVAPAAGFALLAGFAGGGVAIGVAWGLDPTGWAP